MFKITIISLFLLLGLFLFLPQPVQAASCTSFIPGAIDGTGFDDKAGEAYRWYGVDNCQKSCSSNSDCPTSSIDNKTKDGWCYGFDNGNRCIQLQWVGVSGGTHSPDNCSEIRGWSCDPLDYQNSDVEVEFWWGFKGGQFIGKTTANVETNDSEVAKSCGNSNSRHGYVFPLPDVQVSNGTLKDGKSRDIYVYARYKNGVGGYQFVKLWNFDNNSNGPVNIQCTGDKINTPPPPKTGTPGGFDAENCAGYDVNGNYQGYCTSWGVFETQPQEWCSCAKKCRPNETFPQCSQSLPTPTPTPTPSSSGSNGITPPPSSTRNICENSTCKSIPATNVDRYKNGPCAGHDNDCTFDTRTFYTHTDGHVWESVTAYGKSWNWDMNNNLSPITGSGSLLSSVDRYKNGPCAGHDNDCTFDTRTFYTHTDGHVWESVTAYGKSWNWDMNNNLSPITGSGSLLSSVDRYKNGPCAGHDNDCTFDTRTFYTHTDGHVWESVTAYGKSWNWDMNNNLSPITGSGSLLSSVDRYKNGPCAGHDNDCTFDTRTFYTIGQVLESITAYGKYWNFKTAQNNSALPDNGSYLSGANQCTVNSDCGAPKSCLMSGDINKDGLLNEDDFNFWKEKYFLATSVDSCHGTGSINCKGTGSMDLTDFNIWRYHFLKK